MIVVYDTSVSRKCIASECVVCLAQRDGEEQENDLSKLESGQSMGDKESNRVFFVGTTSALCAEISMIQIRC